MMKRFIMAVILLMMIPAMVIAEQSTVLDDIADPHAIIDVLSNGYRLCPSGISLERLDEAYTILNDALFKGGEDAEPYKGTVWLLYGTVQTEKLGNYIDVDGKKIVIDRILNREDPLGNYEIPEVGTSANFYLTYFGAYDGYALFHLGDITTGK